MYVTHIAGHMFEETKYFPCQNFFPQVCNNPENLNPKRALFDNFRPG